MCHGASPQGTGLLYSLMPSVLNEYYFLHAEWTDIGTEDALSYANTSMGFLEDV